MTTQQQAREAFERTYNSGDVLWSIIAIDRSARQRRRKPVVGKSSVARTLDVSVLVDTLAYDPLTGFVSRKDGKYLQTFRKGGYLIVVVNNVKIRAHRAAWAVHYGSQPPLEIDHKNRITDDNRIDNLRDGTTGNRKNRSSAPGRHLPRGVYKKRDKYRVEIECDGFRYASRTMASMDQAAHEYNKAAVRLHGEYAILNAVGEPK